MKFCKKQLSWIRAQQEEMCDQLRIWAGINSGSFNPIGLAALAGSVFQEFTSIGETLSLIESTQHEFVDAHGEVEQVPLGKNLHATTRPDAPYQVLLAIHMDTVYGVESPFQSVELIDANTLRGPGVADAKGGLVVLLFALRAFERYVAHSGNYQLGWEVIINSDEEIGSPGSTELFRQAAERVDWGLLFEPSLSDGNLVSSRKGSGSFSIIAHGRSSHSGRDFHYGINAVVAAAEASVQLHQLTGLWEGMTLNVARIDGGGASNVVPGVSVIRLNIRYEDTAHEPEILSAIHTILGRVSEKSGVQFQLHGRFTAPPKLLDAGTEAMLQEFKQCGESLEMELSWHPTGGTCDGNRLAAFGVPCVDSLGVQGGMIHSDQEYVRLSSLTERAQLTAMFLAQLADGAVKKRTRE
ncbi:hydrolase [Planctomicrobium sp. SH668]|uniref:hydrolase n=1 Tax=Planctomicrobium sp. SH668 TaxID=3448126 RepID=UPI003F5C3EDE